MKKFLSLVLAMIMALSLVTISAGAVEYADLTDTDEITYEEAVSVLNKIGIIEGYPDGSYKPQAALTRQVAAKFIVSLLIGPSAAENLTVAVAPYPDVPVSSQFAGYISYCKTAGIISGYSDGTFKPEAGLTGYAFSKMLLGALGYKSDIEGFTGTGYTMNVARIGNAAGLFNRIEFHGGEILDRETAAQLCLNTLKATMVEYSGGFNITSGDATIVGAQTRSYVTSNQEYAIHINNRRAATGNPNNQGGDLYTVEFGEEHFKDLRMHTEGNAHDTFGRPATEWSWKMVTFGTFALEPDFVYTSQVAYRDDDSNSAKVRALGMNGFTLEKNNSGRVDTHFLVNGDDATYDGLLTEIADIADWTDNGTLVEAYIDLEDDDFLSHVVVIRSELMKVKKVGSDYVSLEKWDDNSGSDVVSAADRPNIAGDGLFRYAGFNQEPLNVDVEDVEIEDTCYEFLSGLKAGDAVVIIPVTDDEGDTYTVGDAYVPETVSGSLTRVDTYAQKGNTSGDRSVTGLTLGGTKYKTSLWNFKIIKIDATDISVTTKDVTLTLDAYGYAMVAKDVGSTNDYIVISNFYQEAVNRKITYVVEGFDMDGNKVELNVGTSRTVIDPLSVGDLVKYTNAGTLSNGADWKILTQEDTGNPVTTANGKDKAGEPWIYEVNPLRDLKKSHTRVALLDSDPATLATVDETLTPDYADGVKFVFVNFRDADEVESVSVLKGAQDVTMSEILDKGDSDHYQAQAYLSKAPSSGGAVKAVVIKTGGTLSNNVLYVIDKTGFEGVDDDGDKLYGYKVAVVNGNAFDDDAMIVGDLNLRNGDFATWTDTGDTVEDNGKTLPVYTMRRLNETQKSTSAAMASIAVFGATNGAVARVSNYHVNNNWTNDGKLDANVPGTAHAADYAENQVEVNINLDVEGEDADIWGDAQDALRISTGNWVNQSGVRGLDSAKALKAYLDDNNKGHDSARIRFVFNDKMGDDEFRTARLVVLDAVGTWAGLNPGADKPVYTDPTPDTPIPASEDSDDDPSGVQNDVKVLDNKVEITGTETAAGSTAGQVVDKANTKIGVELQTENALGGVETRVVLMDERELPAKYTEFDGEWDVETVIESVDSEMPSDAEDATPTTVAAETALVAALATNAEDEIYYIEIEDGEDLELAAADAWDNTPGEYYIILAEADGDYTMKKVEGSYLAATLDPDRAEGTAIYEAAQGQTPTMKEETTDNDGTPVADDTAYAEADDPNDGITIWKVSYPDSDEAGVYKITITADAIDTFLSHHPGAKRIINWVVYWEFKDAE